MAGLLRLYHGSKSGLVGDIAPTSRWSCDFGRGFYMGTDAHQPQTLICRQETPKFYAVEFDLSDLTVRTFEPDLLWALFVAYNRGEMSAYAETPLCRRLGSLAAGTDVFVGRIANDRIFYAAQSFFRNVITLETLSEVLKAVNLGEQYCAISAKACRRVRVVSEKSLSAAECESLRRESDVQRRRAVELTDAVIRRNRHVDGTYFDELCEKYADGEVPGL